MVCKLCPDFQTRSFKKGKGRLLSRSLLHTFLWTLAWGIASFVSLPSWQLCSVGSVSGCKAIMLRAPPARLTATPLPQPWHWVDVALLSGIILLDVSAFVVILLDFPGWALSQSGQEQFDSQQSLQGFCFNEGNKSLTDKITNKCKIAKQSWHELSSQPFNPDFLTLCLWSTSSHWLTRTRPLSFCAAVNRLHAVDIRC